MKKNSLLLFLCILGSVFSLLGQDQKSIEDQYAAYFTLPREGLYLHLNKTNYFAGEEIWFKGYAFDQKNQLISKATTNINVGIYDAEGNQVKKGLFEARDGITKGNFAVDSTFTAGTYYIKAETNWMKNFKEDNAYVQKIEIITDANAQQTKENLEERFDFQFLPEGGYIVVNTTSNVGFKVIDNKGKGVSASGIVYDENKKQVASFESNTLGMGKFLFQPKKDKKYTAEITLENGTVLTKPLPKAKDRGLSMILKTPSEDKIVLEFSTNEETLASNPEKQYKVLIHQNGNLKTAALRFNGTEKAVSVRKDELFKGVNTITVFDEQQNPIVERLFFNDHNIKKASINVSKLNTIKDSILLSINELNLNDNANLSISILPEETKSYNPQHNILSNFYLKPHVKGFIENPQYYFHDMDRKKKYELDVLLLTQGWSRYNWDDIFGTKPNALNRFETGITISGRVNRPTVGVKRIMMYPTKKHPSQFIELDENQEFKLNGLFFEEGEEIRFSYTDEKGLLKKPSMYIRFIVTNKEDQISEVVLNEAKTDAVQTANFSVPKDFFYENAEELEKVVIKGARKNEPFNDPTLVNARVTDITMDEYIRFINLAAFLEYNGYQAVENALLGQLLVTTRRSPRASPVFFLDDARLFTYGNILYNFSLANLERVVIDKTGVGQGVLGGFGGVIKLYTRRTPLFESGPGEDLYLATKAPFAFSEAKEYYAPNYNSYQSEVFQQYGAISWIPELKLEKTKASNFKIYDTYTDKITLFIEGITENGDLISEKRTIQLR
jgi:hypothetical protein